MRIKVGLVKKIPCPLHRSFVEEVIGETLTVLGYPVSKTGNIVGVDVAFVSKEEIQSLNKAYRKKNKVTDVLSFPEHEGKVEVSNVEPYFFLGDLIVCYDYIKQLAIEDGVSLEREMAYMISHGTLHLLGFRHSKRMFALQDAVTEKYI